MSKKTQSAQLGIGTLIDPTGILGTNLIRRLPNQNYLYTLFSSEDFRMKRVSVIFNPSIQRMYLFNDVHLGTGAKWQRNLFKSLLRGEPVGTVELWYNPITKEYEVLDAQQRLKTLEAIFNDCVMTPTGLIIDGIDCGGKHYSTLPTEIRDKFTKYTFLVTISYTELEDAVERFIGINNSNPLSAQDKRSPQVSDFAKFIREIAEYKQSNWKFSKYINVDSKLQFEYFSFPHYGRSMDEVLSYLYLVIEKQTIQSYSQTELDKLYLRMKENTSAFTTKDRKEFIDVLNVIEKLIGCKSWNKTQTKKKDFLYLLLVVNHLISLGGSISELDAFIKSFYLSIQKCRANKKLMFTSSNGEVSDFATVWRLGTGSDFIQFIVQSLLKEINNVGIVYKDTKRTFSQSEKEQKLFEQNCKCAYCSKQIDPNETYYGDHMLPHTKGGKTIYENLAVACYDCNSTKSKLDWEAWTHVVKVMSGIDLEHLNFDENSVKIESVVFE
jgi:hypothetical protein